MFKLRNKYLSSLSQWLELQSLTSKENTYRIGFITLLQNKLKEIKVLYSNIIESYVEKDKKGNYKTKEENGVQVFSFKDEKDKEDYLKELTDEYEKEFTIEETDENKEIMKAIKDIVLNTTYKFGPKPESDKQEQMRDIRIAYEYEEWKKAFNN